MSGPNPLISLTVHVHASGQCSVYDKYGNHLKEYEGVYREKLPIFDELVDAETHFVVIHFFPGAPGALGPQWREILTRRFPGGKVPADWRRLFLEA